MVTTPHDIPARSGTASRLTLGALVIGLVGGALMARLAVPGLDMMLAAADPAGRLWLDGLTMTIVPLIVGLLVTGIAAAAASAQESGTAKRAIIWFALLLAGACLLAALFTSVVLALWPVPAETVALHTDAAPPALVGRGDWIAGLIPTNPIKAAAEGTMVPLVIFSLLLGLAIPRIDAPLQDAILALFRAVVEAMLVIVRWVLWLAPIGVFALAFGVGARLGLSAAGALGQYVVIAAGACLSAALLAYGAVSIAGRISLAGFARAALPAQVVALSTQSSLASLPAMIAAAPALRVSNAAAGVTLPLAVSLFRAASAAANVAVAIYLGHLHGVPLTFGVLLLGALVAVPVSLAAVGLPAQVSFFATIAPVCVAMGVPIGLLPLLLAVETIPDIFRTFGNVTADLAVLRIAARNPNRRCGKSYCRRLISPPGRNRARTRGLLRNHRSGLTGSGITRIKEMSMARKPSPKSAPKTKGETPKKAPRTPADAALSASFAETQGNGGETHQIAGGGVATLTTSQGAPVADDQNSLKYGARGPVLLEDPHFREKIFHFDHERIPERVVHARGYGAHGFFELTESLADVTRADIFQRVGERTPAFVRFSTVAGSKGSPDLARDVRGFAVKLYTQEGNWDLVGNNIPVFFIQDAIKFPDLIHAAKPEPDRAFPQAQTAHDNFWDFISLTPESMHMIMWIMSDRTIPRSFRTIEGFGVHTFRLIDAAGKSTFVKFHWKPKQGLQSVLWNEAVKINGADPDFHRRDLWDAINGGDFPEWQLGVQLFDEDFANGFDFDVLDATKLIPEELVPVRIVGRLVLDRVVDNFFAETEQVAFCTQNIVPGIDFTNDPLLQGRNFSYLDTQLKRLGGPNFTHIPINAAKSPVANFQQDGHMAISNPRGRVNYEPNSWGAGIGGPREDPQRGLASFAATEDGPKLRIRPESFADHYSQARQFLKSQLPIEQKHIGDALVFELSKVERPDIRARIVSHLLNIDADLAATVADGLGLADLPAPAQAARPTIDDLPPSDALSILKNGPASFKGRKLGIVLSDGADAVLFNGLVKALDAAEALYEVIAPKIGGVVLSDGTPVAAKHKIDGGPSVLFDAVAVLASDAGAALLATDAATQDFVRDAFGHCKYIGLTKEAEPIFVNAGIADKLDDACLAIATAKDASAFVDKIAALRFWPRELNVDLDAK